MLRPSCADLSQELLNLSDGTTIRIARTPGMGDKARSAKGRRGVGGDDQLRVKKALEEPTFGVNNHRESLFFGVNSDHHKE